MKRKGKKQRPADGELRQSQLITTFGVGSMVDLPDHSVLISGLSYWRGDYQPIHEERLQRKIAQILGVPDVALRTPPRQSVGLQLIPAEVDVFVFPSWFLAQVEGTIAVKGKEYRTRPLVRWKSIQGGNTKVEGKLYPVVPVRFVQACVNGHLSDIDWHGFVHYDDNRRCLGQLWLDEAGSGNDFEEIFVRCEACQKRRPLSVAKVPNSPVLGYCQGHRPWLGARGQEACISHRVDDQGNLIIGEKPEYNRLLVRSASNAYFSQTLSAISLPEPDARLRQAIDRFYEEDLKYAEDIADIRKELRKPKFVDLAEFDPETVWDEVLRRKNGAPAGNDKSIKQVELEALLSARGEFGKKADPDFDARPRSLETIDDRWKPYLDRVVLVHRLREVIAQIGFTRFEGYLSNIEEEEEVENLSINVRLAKLDFQTDWVPAIENKGEGVFIGFRKEAIEEWTRREAVKKRSRSLIEGFERWRTERGISADKCHFPGLPYILLHSLSHLLITSVSLECGYSASAIKERIYCFDDIGYGILLYTGASGSEGTLGGLVELGNSIETHLEKALEFGRLCSNDPVCARHYPPDSQEARYLNGAACHGCLLIAETSCERRNEFLDRTLVVNTIEELGAAFFPDELC